MIKIKEKTYDEQLYISLIRGISNTKRKISIVSGIGLIIVGVVTLPVPTGSVQMISAGVMLIFIPNTSIKKMYSQMMWHFKTKIKMRKNK